MIANDKARFYLARIIGQRTKDVLGPSEKSETDALAELCSISSEKAEAVLWGEVGVLSPDEMASLSGALHLSYDILCLISCPASQEIIDHVLRGVQENDLDSSCSICLRLSDQIFETTMGQTELLLKLLEHLHFEEDNFLEPAQGEDELLALFREMEPDARSRVLALAYGEVGGDPEGRAAKKFSDWSCLQREYLSSLVCQVLDLLAREDRALSAGEIASQLPGVSAHSVGQCPRALEKALLQFQSENGKSVASPLVVRRREGRSFYSIHPEAREPWLAAARSRQSLGW